MGNNTTTHNEDSKNYCLSPEQAAELMAKTDRCSVVVTPQKDINKYCISDVMAANIVTARKIEEGIRPENQGDAIDPQYAAEFGENGLVIVTDKSKGKSTNAEERAENETQKASRERMELERRAAQKYDENNSQTAQTTQTDAER